MNNYYESIKYVKNKISEYLTQIYKVYGNELLLRLEDYNLLSCENNCIETSTATGFIMEEFITSKLEIYCQNHDGIKEIKVEKLKGQSTVNSSYDCFVNYNGILFMINIKVQKEGSANNAVAAINILHKDYVLTEPERIKSYIVFKTHYSFKNSLIDGERKIAVDKIDSYALEEIDFSDGHRQDHRNWSANFNANSGRLQVPPSWIKKQRMPEDEISYSNTNKFIDNMYNNID